MKQFILVLFLTFITVQFILPQEIFLVDTTKVHLKLNTKEDNLLKKIKARSSTSKVMFLESKNFNQIYSQQNIKIEVFDKGILNFKNKEIKNVNENTIIWIGKNENNSAILVFHENNIIGTITVNKEKYKIEPIGDGIHVLIKFDESKLPSECLEEINDNDTGDSNDALNNNSPLNLNKVNTTSTIDVLVAYTPAAANATGDIVGLIELAVEETNQSYTNSDIAINMRLVKTTPVSYTESGNISTDVTRFQGTSDGYMDEIHTLRNKYFADVCVLILTDNTYCGMAYEVYASESTSFSAVDYDCATGYYSFGHEIGHLQGARHDRQADGTSVPFSYGHGYLYPAGSWRTIMAYPTYCTSCIRIQYWSNPDILYNNVAMGTEQYEDCARVLNETASYISNFRTSTTTTSGTLASNEIWYINSLTGNITVPTNISLVIHSTAEINLNGYTISSSGGTIEVQTGATINGALLKTGNTINAIYPSIASALSSASSGQTIVVSGQHSISNNLTIPTGITLDITSDAEIDLQNHSIVSTGGTIINNGTVEGLVATLSNGSLYPSFQQAMEAASSGQEVQLLASVDIANNFTVNSGITLSVKPNVTLTFGSGKRIYVSGTLSTNGATFQGNGSAGYWNSITLLSGSSGSILNTTIKDAQCGIYATQVSSLTVSNCTIENNSSYGISLSSTDPTISNCTIQSNGTGIISSSSRPTISGCTIQNNTNYGINASSISPSGNYLYWYNNTFTGNGYAVVLNNASPYLHDNDIFDNSHGVVMTSSSTNFADPSNSWKGYNEITCASTPLLKADNYSSIYAGYGYDGGYNSIFGSEQPDMQSLNHSTIYACNNYWGSPYPATYADGTSTILSWYPLGSDPNSSSCSLNKRPVLAKSNTTEDEVDFPEQLADAIASGFNNDFSTAKNLLKTIIENKYDNTYTPLALLTYYNFDLKDQDLNGIDATEYSNDLLTSIYDRSKEDPLRPFAVRLLARDAALKDKTEQMITYNNEIIENYPNTSNEISALYDLANYYYESDQNDLATKYLKRMEDVYPENDLTLFAKINLGLYSMGLKKDDGALNQQIPKVYSLSDNYPNPFNPSTTINYSLPVNEKVVLKVYDILGKEVAILVNEQKPAGNYQVIFNAENLASGLYLYQIKSGAFIQTKKMILMK